MDEYPNSSNPKLSGEFSPSIAVVAVLLLLAVLVTVTVAA